MTQHQNKFKVSSTAMTKNSTPLVTQKAALQPTVFFSDYAWAQLWAIVDYCKKEVGWYGLVEEDGIDYVITELFVPEQEVSGATTDIEPEAMGKLAAELEAAGKDSSKLRYWGHSHVDMAVRPSVTDEDQIEEYLDHCDWFIRGIHNKKRESKVDVYNVTENIVHQCVDNGRFSPYLDKDAAAALKKMIDDNVKEKVYSRYQNNWNQRKGNPQTTAEKQKEIDAYWDDDYEWTGYGYGGNVTNFKEGADLDEISAREQAFYTFLMEDVEFATAYIKPFQYASEIEKHESAG